jgi:hypothetical protein
MRINDRTPVLIGVGEASELIGAPYYAALSPADLAANAAKRAPWKNVVTGWMGWSAKTINVRLLYHSFSQAAGCGS